MSSNGVSRTRTLFLTMLAWALDTASVSHDVFLHQQKLKIEKVDVISDAAAERSVTDVHQVDDLYGYSIPSSTDVPGSKAAQGTNRVAWVHVPKAGTSFGTTLAHYANSSLPADALLESCNAIRDNLEDCRNNALGLAFTTLYSVDTYFKDLLWMKHGNWGAHVPITTEVWNQFNGHFFGMFRETVSWIRSRYNFFGQEGESLVDYYERSAGMATHLLSENRDVTEALTRLEQFSFVGMTDEYRTSICLFHLKFSTPCLPVEFIDIRPGKPKNNKNISQDVYEKVVEASNDSDKILNARAKAIFDADVAKYGATRERCAQICPSPTAVAEYAHDVLGEERVVSLLKDNSLTLG